MFLFALSAFAAPPAAPAERPVDTWDLSTVYPTLDAWEADLEKTNAALDSVAACQGKLAAELGPCLQKRFEAQKSVARAFVYAGNLANADTHDSAWQARSQRAEMLMTNFGEKTAFFSPELLTLGSPAVEAALTADSALAPYTHYLRSTLLNGPHTLDAQGEALLAATGTILGGPERARSQLYSAELPWPTIQLADGTSVELTPAGYTNARGLPLRADREKVFQAFFGAIKAFEGTFGATLDSTVQGHWMVARARNYETSLAASIDVDHVPPAVYQTLVAETNKNLPTLHRYLRLRGRMMGITDLAYHDLYPPVVASDRTWTVDQAAALTLDATKPLGPAYTAALQKGFAGRWMDVYPRPGKTAGAYMDGAAYDVHPFLLLNYTGDYESVSTLAHEWGHAIHSVFSSAKQPYATSDYSTFIAEIASTCNEALLLRHMLAQSKSDDEKLYYLGNALESLRTTYFRQAQLAEFELAIHTQVEKGEPLTGESLDAAYLDILRRYYGEAEGVTHVDDLYGVEWAYIPHFYWNFYVYQYATSIAASSQFAEDILAKKPGALERYTTLLESGSADDPYPLLKQAGVDLASPAPYAAIARQMNGIMDQMEAILAKKDKATKKGKK